MNSAISQRACRCVLRCGEPTCPTGDALDAVELLLPDGIAVFAFDFSGSGHSDGSTISLGFYEKLDVECVVKHLRGTGSVSTIGIWGRSMGAATALLYCQMDPSIACIVLDSAFTSLKHIMHELAAQCAFPLPRDPRRRCRSLVIGVAAGTYPAFVCLKFSYPPQSPCSASLFRDGAISTYMMSRPSR